MQAVFQSELAKDVYRVRGPIHKDFRLWCVTRPVERHFPVSMLQESVCVVIEAVTGDLTGPPDLRPSYVEPTQCDPECEEVHSEKICSGCKRWEKKKWIRDRVLPEISAKILGRATCDGTKHCLFVHKHVILVNILVMLNFHPMAKHLA